MSKLNLLIHMNGYEDANSSNEPTLNNFKWNRDYLGLEIDEPSSKLANLSPGETKELFSSNVSINADGTTTYDISLKTGTSSTYKIAYNSGTAPEFRTARVSGADATTEVTVTKNGNTLKFESTSGTLFDLISNGVVVGDRVRIGSVFNSSNQGKFTIIAVTATSFIIENEFGFNESNIVLGADFSEQINIYSSSGVQVGDKIDIENNFSLVTQGTYEITDVSHDYIEFHSVTSLPEETNVSNDPSAFSIYRGAKQLIYIEANTKLNIKINGSSVTNTITPFQYNGSVKPGVFLSKSVFKSVTIENPTTSDCKVYYITAE